MNAPLAPQKNPLQFPCGACGAKLEFVPGQASLKCPYCGHAEEIPQTEAEIREYDFDHADLARRSRGWGTDLKPVKCELCGALTEVAPQVSALVCAFCGSNQVIPREQNPDLLKPESLVPFQVSNQQVADQFKEWISGLWFRPNALKRQARPDAIRGVYIPFWTFDAMTHSFWNAEAGYHYYVTESYTDAQGKRGTRQVQKTRWEPASGSHSAFYDDVLVAASKSVDERLVKELEPYDTKSLVAYKPEYLAGMIAEDYQADVKQSWPRAKDEIDGRIRSECARRVPGDTHRNLRIRTSYNNRRFKLCLLPVWIASYLYQGRTYRYLVNGQTGKVSGEAPWSWIKITLTVLVIVAIVIAIVMAQQGK